MAKCGKTALQPLHEAAQARQRFQPRPQAVAQRDGLITADEPGKRRVGPLPEIAEESLTHGRRRTGSRQHGLHATGGGHVGLVAGEATFNLIEIFHALGGMHNDHGDATRHRERNVRRGQAPEVGHRDVGKAESLFV